MPAERREPEIVLREGSSAAVHLPIEEHQEMLERPEELDDLRALEEMRRRALTLRRLEEFLQVRSPHDQY